MIQSQSIETPYKRGEMLSNMILYEDKNFQPAIKLKYKINEYDNWKWFQSINIWWIMQQEEEIVFPSFYLTLKMNIKSDILHIQYTKYILCKAINT